MRAAIYIRVSTQEQAIHGLSLEKQLTDLRAWCRENGYEIAGEYADEGVSARKAAKNRPELQRLIRDIETQKIDLVVFTKLDRWFRNIKEYYKVQDILDRYKVAWRAIYEDYNTQTSDGMFKVNIMLSIAQAESDRTSERIKVVKQLQRDKMLMASVSAPIGLKNEKGQLVIDPDTANIAQDMFDCYLATGSLEATVKYLIQEHGVSRSHNNLKHLLQNRRYIGELYGKKVCDPLISEADFARVQTMLQQRGQRNAGENHVYLFTGLLFCAVCGHRLVTTSVTPKTTVKGKTYCYGRKYYYYKCPNVKKGLCVNTHRVNEAELERLLLNDFKPGLLAVEIEQQPPRVVNREAVQKKLGRLRELYVEGYIDKETYEADHARLSARMLMPAPAPDMDKIRTGYELYQDYDNSEKRAFWTRIIEKMVSDQTGDIQVQLFGYTDCSQMTISTIHHKKQA